MGDVLELYLVGAAAKCLPRTDEAAPSSLVVTPSPGPPLPTDVPSGPLAALCPPEQLPSLRERCFPGPVIALIDDAASAATALADGADDTIEAELLATPAGWRVLQRRIRDAMRPPLTPARPPPSEMRGRLERLLAASPDIVCLLSPALDLVYASPTVRDLLGGYPESLFTARAHHADRSGVTAKLHALASADPGTTLSFEHRVADITGRWRWLSTVVVNRRDDPLLAGLVAVSRDITASRDAGDARRRRQAALGAAFHAAPHPMAIMQPDGRIELANSALGTLVGRPPEALVNTSMLDLVHEDERTSARALLALSCLEEATPSQRLGWRLVRPDGSTHWCWVVVSATGPESALSLLLCQVADVSTAGHLAAPEERPTADLLDELTESRAHSRRLARALVEYEEAARRRVSSALHDETLQLIVAALWELDAVTADAAASPHLVAARRALLEAQTATLTAMEDLSSSVLEAVGLAAALRGALESLSSAGITVETRIDITPDTPGRAGQVALRLLRNAVTALALSDATAVSLSASTAPGLLYLEMIDDARTELPEIDDAASATLSAAGGTLRRLRRGRGGHRLVAYVPLT